MGKLPYFLTDTTKRPKQLPKKKKEQDSIGPQLSMIHGHQPTHHQHAIQYSIHLVEPTSIVCHISRKKSGPASQVKRLIAHRPCYVHQTTQKHINLYLLPLNLLDFNNILRPYCHYSDNYLTTKQDGEIRRYLPIHNVW